MTLPLPCVPPPSLAIAGHAQRFPVGRVFCAGRNYPWPDAPDSPPDMPFFFMKPASAVVPAEGLLPYPAGTVELCFEVEMVVAIGRHGAHLSPAQALDHVWGYGVGLDMTCLDRLRQAQQRVLPWDLGKAFVASAPCAPLVPVAVCGHPRQGAVWLTLNGQERQRGDVSQLLMPVADLLAALSQQFGLCAGDLLFTGTPPGVAPLWPGDTVSAGVAGLGQLTMTVGPSPNQTPQSLERPERA